MIVLHEESLAIHLQVDAIIKFGTHIEVINL